MQKFLIIMPQSIGGRLTISSIADGLKANDIEIEIFDLLKNNQVYNSSKKYDFVLGYDYGAIEFCLKNKIKKNCINYFSDVINDTHSGIDWKTYYPYLKEKSSLTLYWDKDLTKRNKEIKNLFYLPHFVNTDLYKNTNSQKTFDIIFTGRLDTDYRLNTFLNLMKALPNYKFGWYAHEKHYKDAIERTNKTDKNLIDNSYQSFIDNEKDMSKILNNTKIVINFNEQGVSSLNYRTIQAYACETFLLSDYREEGIDYFKENYIYYKNFNDMTSKTEFYLKNEKERKNISKNLRSIIEKDFSHTVGAKKILQRIEEVFNV